MSNSIVLILGAILFLINVRVSHGGKKLYWFYELSHFLGGFLMAGLLVNFKLSNLGVLVGVLVMGLIWEFNEFVITHNNKLRFNLEKRFNYFITPPKLGDTLLDLFLDIVGASWYLWLYGKGLL